MAYSDFTASDLTQKFGLRFAAGALFPAVKKIKPSNWLTEALRKGQELGFASEKSRSERLVTPILLEISDRNNHQFSIYSGMNMDVDAANGLRGECDFIFSRSRIQDFVTAPIFCVAEAKRQDIEQGTIQAAAQLVGAKKMNEMEGNEVTPLYGCSTSGLEWRFLKFENHTLTIDENRYLLSDLSTIIGILQVIVDSSIQHSAFTIQH